MQKINKGRLKPNQRLDGVIKRHPDGYGFFIPDDQGLPDVYIAKHNMEGVMTNDRVRVMVRPDRERWRGEVTDVLERTTKQVTGKFKRLNRSQGALRDESFGWGEDLKVSVPPQMEVKDGEWVTVKITSYPESIRGFQGEVTAIIGDISDPKNDNHRILAAHAIPYQFSKECLAQAATMPTEVSEKDFAGRTDLRSKKLVTIDGKTAKDFDDAVYVEKMKTGFRLWVAIADVSHYVRPGSAIDKDAYQRGTSTYFPGFVAPMLPEVLSNELCSLKPEVPRLALVAEMDLDFNGEMKSSKFYEAVMRSHARVTYGEAQEVLDGDTPERLRHVAQEIKLAGELAHILMKRRFDRGSLNLEIAESTIELDDSGVPIDIIKSERLFAHRLIEELMLQANIAVAKFLNSRGVPGLFRIHESPKLEAIEILERFLEIFGYGKRLGAKNLQKRLNEALEEFRGAAEESVVNILTLRSMQQARYSPHNVGHFGLGFEDYAHFTSPIRRYPDLIIHRLVKAALGISGYRKMGMDDLEEAGTITSGCEQRSVKAERQIQSVKKARFLHRHLGEEMDGYISSVTKFGVFVTLRRYDVDGLLRVDDLGQDRFEFDEENLSLVGRRSGLTFKIGDLIKVQVANTDYETGRIDFVLTTGDEVKNAAKASNKPIQKRRETEGGGQHAGPARFSRHRRENSRENESRGRRGHRKNSSRKHK